MLAPPVRVPLATYRVQLNGEFDFDQARSIVPYLAALGISELYASPIFQASSCSSHGYDVNDYNSISLSLGGEKGLARLSADLRARQLGLLVDFVPNHMGIDGEHNSWWRHVLEHGAQSKYAPFFDIEWHPRLERLNDRVLVRMLGDRYGTVLEGGQLKLCYDKDRLVVRYGSLKLPISPGTYRMIFDQIDERLPSGDPRKTRLRELGDAFENLTLHDPQQRDEQFDELRSQWARLLAQDESLRQMFEAVMTQANGKPGEPPSFVFLHRLLEEQNFRLAHWKVGAHEVNYRRFFAVDTLVGLKMEDQEVFDATHRFLGELISAGEITGIRLDHIDGLWNPVQYLQRLAELVQSKRPAEAPLWTLVEKILAVGETLPASWPVHGTSGYEFAASLIEVFLDRSDEPAWTKIYREFTGEIRSSLDLTYQDKLFALEEIFPNAVSNLAAELDALIQSDWHKRDISQHDLKTALRHFLACLSVYRTYRMPGEEISEWDKRCVTMAIDEGIRRNPCVDPLPLRFVGEVLKGDYPWPDFPPEKQEAFARWVCKLQQATGAVMAKSVEDTHFYRYVRMFGANEVGSHPSRFGAPLGEFHHANSERLAQAPYCMLTTSTHDTKLSEDARARLFALAELPDEWASHLSQWRAINQPAHRQIENQMAPDACEEYLFYQVLLAAWPLQATTADAGFRERIKAYFRKALGEAKRNTSYTFTHQGWLDAGDAFIETVLDSREFLHDFLPFQSRIAKRGMVYSLAQTVLRLTCPGVPDLYQGNEIWDFSLVDPDNRRPIDFNYRINLLAALDSRTPVDLVENWQDGGIKMQVIRTLLNCRRAAPKLFIEGDYIPVQADGPRAEHIVAFRRRIETMELLVVVPRHLGKTDETNWHETRLSGLDQRPWRNVLSNQSLAGTESIGLDRIFADLPVSVLISP